MTRTPNNTTAATTPQPRHKPPLEIRLRVLAAIDYAPGTTLRERIQHTATQSFLDPTSGIDYRFTWRTISTWLYRYKKNGVTTLDNATRSDKHHYRKIQPNELAEAINDLLPSLKHNKVGIIPRSVIYRQLMAKNYVQRSQLSQTSFYRMVRENDLLDATKSVKLRQSFAMQFVNELWQADTMYGPSIKQPDGSWRKTYLIAFIDDASRVITHAQFFYRDNTNNMIEAFRTALYKRGKPERLYFDNGANYSAKEIHQACLRLNIRLSHAPIRDGAAKGKIERFFRGFRDRFLTLHPVFESLESLNQLTHEWVENEYNNQYHSGIRMIPLDRFNLDITRVNFIHDDQYNDEVFFIEEERKVGKTNVFSINSTQFEAPVDLRGKTIGVRYSRTSRDRFVVYFNDARMGEATRLDLQANARRHTTTEQR